MGEASADEGCSFSLMCLEDGADLDAAAETSSAGDGSLLAAFLYSDDDAGEGQDQEEEYMDHLVSKESSFCCSPCSTSPSSSSSPVFSDIAGAEPCPPSSMESSDEWFRRARRATVQWIFETRACFGFAHRTAYLAVSYMDRFCLRRRMETSVMPWAARLLAVACVSLAAKMEEYHAPPLSEFRAADEDYGFSSDCVRRMELLVLSTLDWRLGDVTPLDYLPCLSSRLRRGGGGGTGGGLIAAKAAALIFSAAEAASVLDYRPSTVAVAAVLAAAHGGAMAKEAFESKMSSLSPSCLLDKDDVHACYSTMLSERRSSSATPVAKRKRPPPPSSGGSPHEESLDAASSSFADSNKRPRVELPAAVGP